MHSLEYASPSNDNRSGLFRASPWDGLLASLFLLLSGASFWIVAKGANDEPYAGPIQASDGVVQVGLASVAIFAWAQFVVLTIWLVSARRAIVFWILAPLWGLICAGYLAVGVYGYMADLKNFHQPVWPSSP